MSATVHVREGVLSITSIIKPCPGNFGKRKLKFPGHDETYTPKHKNFQDMTKFIPLIFKKVRKKSPDMEFNF